MTYPKVKFYVGYPPSAAPINKKYYKNSSLSQSLVNGRQFTFSAWFYLSLGSCGTVLEGLDGTRTNTDKIFRCFTYLNSVANKRCTLEVYDTLGNAIIDFDFSVETIGAFGHIMVSFDGNTPVKGGVWLDGNQVVGFSDANVVENTDIDFSGIQEWFIGADLRSYVSNGAGVFPTGTYSPQSAIEAEGLRTAGEVFFNPSFIDLDLASNRDKFYLAGNAPELGENGEIPLGFSPYICCRGGLSTFGTNIGTLNSFTPVNITEDFPEQSFFPFQLPNPKMSTSLSASSLLSSAITTQIKLASSLTSKGEFIFANPFNPFKFDFSRLLVIEPEIRGIVVSPRADF